MKQITNAPDCERGEDLVSFLYGEASEREARDFEKHLQQCRGCQSEVGSFGRVREFVADWKMEALTGLSPAQLTVAQPVGSRSAIAAVREFLALSPLWLKGAVAFATVLFCVLAVLTLGRWQAEERQPAVAGSDAKYSEQQLRAMIEKAVADERAVAQKSASSPADANVAVKTIPKQAAQRKGSGRVEPASVQMAKGRRPLSKSEREQLAADLRLFSTHDDEGLNLLGDRINQ